MRSVTGTGLVVAALVATAAALLFPIWSFAGRPSTGSSDPNTRTVGTRFGPLSALDRDFVNRVRLAGLWELPAGQQAQERGTTRAVRTAGDHLVSGHTELDRRVREVASQLGLALPNQPNPQQRGWLSELSAAHGPTYDRTFANILRRAHGTVFPLVAEVRTTTRNALVRGLADDANATVLDHITVLERTGLVDFDAIAREAATAPPPPSPSAPPPSGDGGPASAVRDPTRAPYANGPPRERSRPTPTEHGRPGNGAPKKRTEGTELAEKTRDRPHRPEPQPAQSKRKK